MDEIAAVHGKVFDSQSHSGQQRGLAGESRWTVRRGEGVAAEVGEGMTHHLLTRHLFSRTSRIIFMLVEQPQGIAVDRSDPPVCVRRAAALFTDGSMEGWMVDAFSVGLTNM